MIRRTYYGIVPALFLLIFSNLASSGTNETTNNISDTSTGATENTPPADQITLRMIEQMKRREAQLLRYSVDRVYEVKADDKNPAAVINAEMTFSRPPAAKDFK